LKENVNPRISRLLELRAQDPVLSVFDGSSSTATSSATRDGADHPDRELPDCFQLP
jgi:hypothetical protein